MKKVATAQENRNKVYEAMKAKGWNGKDFDRKLYEDTATELGVFKYGKVIGTFVEDTKVAEAPKKTARGSSKKTTKKTTKEPKTLEERVTALENAITDTNSKLDLILAKLG